MNDERDPVDTNRERDPVELSRRLVYFAAERTLTSWIRTALSLMALGFVIDRFDLILRSMPNGPEDVHFAVVSNRFGSMLIGMGVLMALVAGVRYLRFAIAFHREGSTRVRHGIYMGAASALLLALIGVALIVLLTTILG